MNLIANSAALLESVTHYFQGEMIEALVFILPAGLVSLVFGFWLVAENSSAFIRGVAIPFLVMGLLMTVVGAVVGYRTPTQVTALRAHLQGEPGTALAAEKLRMSKVNGAWRTYLAVWAILGITGFALRFGTRNEFAHGLGIAMVLFCGVGLLIDGFAERRAHTYAAALEATQTPRSN